MIQIEMSDETGELSASARQLIEDVLQQAAASEQLTDDYEVSITIVDDETIRELNRQYRANDTVTDVISFALNETDEEELEIIGGIAERMLGDIVISLPRTLKQAEDYGHSFERELAFLVVHGFLHLLGYRHETDEEEKKMFAKQEDILNEYGLTR